MLKNFLNSSKKNVSLRFSQPVLQKNFSRVHGLHSHNKFHKGFQKKFLGLLTGGAILYYCHEAKNNTAFMLSKRSDEAIKKLYSELDEIIKEQGPESEEAKRLKSLIEISVKGMDTWEETKPILGKYIEEGRTAINEAFNALTKTIQIVDKNESQKPKTNPKKEIQTSVNLPSEYKELYEKMRADGYKFLDQKDYQKACEKFEKSKAILAALDAGNTSAFIENGYNLGIGYRRLGDSENARKNLEEALLLSIKNLGHDHEMTKNIYDELKTM